MDGKFIHFEQTAAAYYSEKLHRHGATPAGVDWNSRESQQLRFEQLLKILPAGGHVSLIDYGCGYGALLSHMIAAGMSCNYAGYDVAEEMIAEATRTHGVSEARKWTTDIEAVKPADYCVASGIFNVKLEAERADWTEYVTGVLDRMYALSARGFAYNMLTTYSDTDKMRPYLYYGDPCFFFDYCKRQYSRHVALLHDYGLWEFTILVRK